MPDLLGASTSLRAASGLLHSSSWLTSWQPWPLLRGSPGTYFVAARDLTSWQPWPLLCGSPWPYFVAALALTSRQPWPYFVAALALTLWLSWALCYFVAAHDLTSWQPRPLTCGSLDQTTHITPQCHRVLFFIVWTNPQQQAALPAACLFAAPPANWALAATWQPWQLIFSAEHLWQLLLIWPPVLLPAHVVMEAILLQLQFLQRAQSHQQPMLLIWPPDRRSRRSILPWLL
jgi:hypothetical protein